jgi:hypothetical protein
MTGQLLYRVVTAVKNDTIGVDHEDDGVLVINNFKLQADHGFVSRHPHESQNWITRCGREHLLNHGSLGQAVIVKCVLSSQQFIRPESKPVNAVGLHNHSSSARERDRCREGLEWFELNTGKRRVPERRETRMYPHRRDCSIE